MDPASLVVAALIYVALTTAQKITEQFGTATAQRLQRLAEAVYTKIRGIPEAETVVQDWEQDPTDTQHQAALAKLIRQLIRDDQRFAQQVEQLQTELRTRLDEQRRAFGALEARLLRPAVVPVPQLPVEPPRSAEPGHVPASGPTGAPAPAGAGMQGVFQRLTEIIDTQLPADQADAITVMLKEAKSHLRDALAGSRERDQVSDLAQEAVNASNTTRQAIAAVSARVEEWIRRRSG